VIAAIRSDVRIDQKVSDEQLISICCALRSDVHSSLGTSPYYMLIGQHFISSGATYKLLRALCLLEDRTLAFSTGDSLELVRNKTRDNEKPAREE